MRRLAFIFAVFALGLVIACGGGDDDDGDDGDGGNGGGNNEPTASASPSDSGNDDDNNSDDDRDDDDRDNDDDRGSSGADSDFCSPDRADAIFNGLDVASLDLGNLQEQFEQMDDFLEDWADSAPGEIRDDVNTLVGGMRGLIEVLEENDYNFLAVGTNAANDPRFLALDDPEFQAASDRVAEYCGFDNTNPVTSGGGSTGSGGSTGGFSVDLPDDFPSELVPPNSTLGFAGDVGFGLTVEFTSDATADEMKAYYEAELGNPTFADSESILWTSGLRTVTISGTDGDLTIVIIILSS